MNSAGDVGSHRPPLQHEPRLRRLEQLFARYPLYFVTACTEGRRHILANATIHQSFREFGAAGLERGVFIGRYVLMPDHVHLFVAFGEEYETALKERRLRGQPVAAVYDRRLSPLSEWMKSLKNALSKTLREMNIAAPHWQKGFFDHLMRSEESYSEKWRYVAENPVRAQLVTEMEAWPYQGEIYPLMAQGRV
jgi:REP element-mobilizing transposase RayT